MVSLDYLHFVCQKCAHRQCIPGFDLRPWGQRLPEAFRGTCSQLNHVEHKASVVAVTLMHLKAFSLRRLVNISDVKRVTITVRVVHTFVVHVCCTSWHLKIVLSIVLHLILAIFVAYGEWVNLVSVSAWHLVLWTSLMYRQRYVVSHSYDKCTYCKSRWIKASAKGPECKCAHHSLFILLTPTTWTCEEYLPTRQS